MKPIKCVVCPNTVEVWAQSPGWTFLSIVRPSGLYTTNAWLCPSCLKLMREYGTTSELSEKRLSARRRRLFVIRLLELTTNMHALNDHIRPWGDSNESEG